jgi:hypothetical protein
MIIDSEFRALIPPLSADERKQLECNLIADGCRDPLVVWNDILLDGHHRYEICTAHKIPFRTVEQPCADRDAAKEWIIRNQFGRRNLPLFVRAELALQLEQLLAPAAIARGRNNLKIGDNAPGAVNSDRRDTRTAQILGRLADTSPETLYRVKHLRRVASEEMLAQLRRGDVTTNHAYTTLQQEQKIPYHRRAPASTNHAEQTRKDDRTLAGQLSALLAELRRQRKENHDDLKTRRWIPGNIVTRLQTEQLNWIETELEHLVVQLRATAADVPSPRAKTARPFASTGDNGHG